MTSLSILETFLSLAVQVTLLIAVTALLARRQRDEQSADYYWAVLHASVLSVTAAAFCFPHLRLTVWGDLHPTENYPPDGAALQDLGDCIGAIWAVGAGLMFLIGVLGMIKASRIVRRAKPNDRLRAQMLVAVPELAAGSRAIDLRLTDDTTGAFCWQIHRPVIALPRLVLSFPPAESAAIVRHELAHLRRQHPLHLFLQRIVEAIFWFHPLVWWASRQAAAAREIRCDRDAVSNRDEVATYLSSLLRLIECHLDQPTLLPAGLSFLGDSSLLARRADLLVRSFDRDSAPPATQAYVLTMLVAVIMCVAVWPPINPRASRRADWSPWPTWSARTLDAIGLPVRDYEVDGHRLDGREG